MTGDATAAWEMVGPQSRESIGGRAEFDELFASSALRDTWQDFRFAEQITAALLTDAPEEEIWVVVVVGNVNVRPTPSTALIARVQSDATVVEPFLPGQSIKLVDLPAPGPVGSVLLPGDTITVNSEPDQLGLVALVDGVPVPDGAYVIDADETVVGVRLSRDLEAGEHQIVVGMVTADGTLVLGTYHFLISTG
jgi:hypothetical protein